MTEHLQGSSQKPERERDSYIFLNQLEVKVTERMQETLVPFRNAHTDDTSSVWLKHEKDNFSYKLICA